MLSKEQEQAFYLAMARNKPYSDCLHQPFCPDNLIEACKGAYEAGFKKGEQFEIAYNEFHDKTEWVQAAFEQSGIHGKYWEMHRADAARELVDQLNRKNHELEGAYNGQQMRIADLEHKLADAQALLRESSSAMRAAHESMFCQCMSNPITNARGKAVDVTELNNLQGHASKIDAFLSATAQPAECCCPKIGEPWNPNKHGADCPVHAQPAEVKNDV